MFQWSAKDNPVCGYVTNTVSYDLMIIYKKPPKYRQTEWNQKLKNHISYNSNKNETVNNNELTNNDNNYSAVNSHISVTSNSTMSVTDGLQRRTGSVSGALLPENTNEEQCPVGIRLDTAPRSLPPILRVGSGSSLATQSMSVSSTNLSTKKLSASGSNLSCGTEQHHLRIKGLLAPPLLSRSHSRGDNTTNKDENDDQESHKNSHTRTRLLFWPHAGPVFTRRGSMMEYEVTSRRTSYDSTCTADSLHNTSLDSISISDLIRGKNYIKH